jgi:hypothetical protein
LAQRTRVVLALAFSASFDSSCSTVAMRLLDATVVSLCA